MSTTLTATTVRKAHSSDLPGASRSLSRAFFDDPVFEWIFPGAERRALVVPAFFDVIVASFHAHDQVYSTDTPAGAALWLPPGAELLTEEEAVAFGEQMEELAGQDAPRLGEVIDLMESNHPHDEDHFYLNFVGVQPTHQGQGLGSALMAPVLERCDREGVPAYLEATTTASRALYERHGFETIGELVCPGGGPSMWPMWRLPPLRPEPTSSQPAESREDSSTAWRKPE